MFLAHAGRPGADACDLDGAKGQAERRPWRLSAKLLIASSIVTVIGFSAHLRQRHARHAARRGNAGAAVPGKPRHRHRRRYQPQHRGLRPLAARRRQQHGAAGDQGRLQADPAPDPVRPCGDREAFRRDRGVRRRGQADRSTPRRSTRCPRTAPTSSISRSIATIPMPASTSAAPMLHRGAYSIVLSRRITGDDGSFRGVVAGSIRFTYFHELFGRLQPRARGDTICVLRHDRTIIMRRRSISTSSARSSATCHAARCRRWAEDSAYSGRRPGGSTSRASTSGAPAPARSSSSSASR